MKGNELYLGVKLPEVKKVTLAYARSISIDLFDFCIELLKQKYTEQKLAGMIIYQELLLKKRKKLFKKDIKIFSKLFTSKKINYWNTADWFAIRIFHEC